MNYWQEEYVALRLKSTELLKKNKELEEKLALAESWIKHHQNSVTVAMKDRRELEEKLAVAERKIKSFDAYVCRDEKLKIAIEELEKMADFNVIMDRRAAASEVLEKIKRR